MHLSNIVKNAPSNTLYLLLTKFEVHTLSYCPVYKFIPLRSMAQAKRMLAIKRRRKSKVRNEVSKIVIASLGSSRGGGFQLLKINF